MIAFLKQIVSNDNPTSSRRVILLFTMFINAFVDLAIIVLAFKICLSSKQNPIDHIDVLNILIKLTMIFKVFILLLSGIITWQNITDTINSVKGLPAGVQQLTQTVETAKTSITATQTTPNP